MKMSGQTCGFALLRTPFALLRTPFALLRTPFALGRHRDLPRQSAFDQVEWNAPYAFDVCQNSRFVMIPGCGTG